MSLEKPPITFSNIFSQSHYTKKKGKSAKNVESLGRKSFGAHISADSLSSACNMFQFSLFSTISG